MATFLIMQLYGPMAAWGEQAVGELRRTAPHPSKSAVLGLCAAAKGIGRDEGEALYQLNQLKFGMLVVSEGLFMRDYHTTQVPPQNKKAKHRYTRRDEINEHKLGTILSTREYCLDALALVALWQESGGREMLGDLQASLLAPKYHLYLGRKACPLSLPLHPKIVDADSLDTAFEQYPLPMVDDQRKLANGLGKTSGALYWEASSQAQISKVDFRVPRYDQLLSRKRWQFESRDEYVRLGKGKEA